MAISLSNYIDINSSVVRPADERSLCGLLVTDYSGIARSATQNAGFAFNTASAPVPFANPTEVEAVFGSTHPATKFAMRYFSYVSPTGTVPGKLIIARKRAYGNVVNEDTTTTYREIFYMDNGWAWYDADEQTYIPATLDGDVAWELPDGEESESEGDADHAPLRAIARIVEESANFGSFAFTEVLTSAQIQDIALWNASLGSEQYLFAARVTRAMAKEELAGDGATYPVSGTNGLSLNLIAEDATGFQSPEFMPMAIGAATDYDAPNSTVNFMFRSFATEVPAVTTDSDFAQFTSLRVNFYGRTKHFGQAIDFYQPGVNMDGVDTGVFFNEMWLRASVESTLITLLTNVAKIPANEDGVTMIENAIIGTLAAAVANGTILVGKPLTRELEAMARYTSPHGGVAVDNLNRVGYDLTVWIVAETESGVTRYTAKYILLYSKGDSIKKIEGAHLLY